jgi:hypothetical protein
MTPNELKKLFEQAAESANFRLWEKGHISGVRFVYACEFGEIWKFTPLEWWKMVTKTILCQGRHEFILSKAMRARPRHITKRGDNTFCSSDDGLRCVNPTDWTVEDWTNELHRA